MEPKELTVKLTIDASEALETLEKVKAELKEIAELKGQVSERPKEITLLLDGQEIIRLSGNHVLPK